MAVEAVHHYGPPHTVKPHAAAASGLTVCEGSKFNLDGKKWERQRNHPPACLCKVDGKWRLLFHFKIESRSILCIFMCACVSAGILWRPKRKGIGSSGVGVAGIYEMPKVGSGNSARICSQEQQVTLSSELSRATSF